MTALQGITSSGKSTFFYTSGITSTANGYPVANVASWEGIMGLYYRPGYNWGTVILFYNVLRKHYVAHEAGGVLYWEQ